LKLLLSRLVNLFPVYLKIVVVIKLKNITTNKNKNVTLKDDLMLIVIPVLDL